MTSFFILIITSLGLVSCNGASPAETYTSDSKLASTNSEGDRSRSVGLEIVPSPCIFGSSVIVYMPNPAVVNFKPILSSDAQYKIKVTGGDLQSSDYQLQSFGIMIKAPPQPANYDAAVALFNAQGKQVVADFKFRIIFETPRGGQNTKPGAFEWLMQNVVTGQGVLGWFGKQGTQSPETPPATPQTKVCA